MKITVRGREPDPTDLPPPGDRRGTAIVEPGQANPPELPVYVTREAYRLMLEHGAQGGRFEVGGFLLGGYHVHRGQPYVDITVAVPSIKAKSEKTHVTFSNEAQREFFTLRERQFPGLRVLGWYHSHPGYSVFLSDYDLFVQRNFFAEPHHVAVVVDPKQHYRWQQAGVFVWHQGDVSQGYHLIVYVQDEP